jgi:hypothetical protein
VQGAAQHGGQQYPMGPVPVPPPAVYHDPNVLRREDQEMQWALEESRKEHERQQARHMSGSDLYAPPAGDPPTSAYSRNGASVVATPHVEEASLNPFQTTAQFPASSQQQDTAGLTLSAKYSPMPTPVLPAQIVQQYSPPQTALNAYSPPQTAPPTGYTPPSTSRYTPPSTLPRQDPGDIFADPPLPPLPAPTSGPSDSSYRPTGFI